MQSEPAITVAMSMRNASRFLRQCIDSVLVQSFADFELLIVDDGSTDGSADIVRSYSDPRIRLISRHHDFIASLNTLLTEARGRYIARMDADDIMMPDRLQRQFDYLEANPDVAAVSTGAVRIDEAGNPIGRITTGSDEAVAVTLRRMCEYNMVCNPASMIRRAAIDRIGLRYDPAYPVASDYRFWCDLLLRGAAIHILPFDAICYRISPCQISTARSDESNAAAARIQRELKASLIEKANPGYHDPVIGDSDRELTLIIPFLNEGEEVENTVRSFLKHGGAGRVEIIVINDCSYDSYPYMERLTAIPGVTYILNRERLGVAASRDKGVSLCPTPYFLLLDAHMRAYDAIWTTEIPRLLRENDRRILCCQTHSLMLGDHPGIESERPHKKTYGAILTFDRHKLMPGITWQTEDINPSNPIQDVPAILGAGYATSKRYWNQLVGLKGLKEYGCDEQFLSLKVWMEGGKCILLKHIVFGHLYRKRMPYKYNEECKIYNSLLISETLFPFREKCMARSSAFLFNKQLFQKAYTSVHSYISGNKELSAFVHTFNKRSFHEIVRLNSPQNILFRELNNDIYRRLPDVASFLMNNPHKAPGLFKGNMGYAIWLFHYSRHINSKKILTQAQTFLLKSWSNIEFNDISFETGFPGIGWGLAYLTQQQFINNNADVLNAFDKILELNLTRFIDNAKGNTDFGIIAYACARALTEDGRNFVRNIATELELFVRKLLGETNDTVVAYYCMLFLGIISSDFQCISSLSLADWMTPHHFIAEDSEFWNVSLKDGVLASSIYPLINK